MFTITKDAIAISIASTVIALGAAGCGGSPEGSVGPASAGTASALSLDSVSRRPPPLPSPTLAVPAGNELEFALNAVGVQIYACQATSTGFGWVFQAPEATLYDCRGRVAGKHFAGPTWQANDGSTVVGAKVAAFTVDPSSIPWLLLQAASHTGDGRMSEVSYIQRLSTSGGVAPASGCDAAHVGDVARVDYTATYFFYESEDGG
jgi:hypothetical protein